MKLKSERNNRFLPSFFSLFKKIFERNIICKHDGTFENFELQSLSLCLYLSLTHAHMLYSTGSCNALTLHLLTDNVMQTVL